MSNTEGIQRMGIQIVDIFRSFFINQGGVCYSGGCYLDGKLNYF